MLLRRTNKPVLPKPYQDPVKNPEGEFEVDNWEISDFVLSRLIPAVGFHPFPLNELMLMTAAVCRFRPEMIFDWGTHIGKSPRVFFEATQAFGIKAEIHSIDLPDEEEHQEHPHNERGKLVRGLDVRLHQGDGVTTAVQLYNSRRDNPKTLFFVDGDHEYDTVRRELETILKSVKDPVILLHDAFYQIAISKYNIGPHQAIEDVLEKMSIKCKRIDTMTGLPGMTLLHSFS